jgi:hypothetical protein
MAALKRRSSSHRFLCLLLASLTLAGPATPLAAQQPARKTQRLPAATQPAATSQAPAAAKLELSYVVPDAAVAAVYRPAQLLKSSAMEMFPVEVLQAAMLKQTGLDPLKAEQVVVSYSPPMNYSAVVRFSEAVGMKDGELTRHTEPGKLDGRDYRKSKDPVAPSIYMPDERTLVAAPDAVLQRLVAAGSGADSPLAKQLVAADRGDDPLYLVDVAALRPMIKQGLAGAQAELPPEAAPYFEIPDLVKTVTMRQNYSHAGLTEVVVAANNEADADRLVELFEGAKKMLAAQVALERDRLQASPDPLEQAMAKYVDRMITKVDALLKLQQEGDQVVLFRADLSKAGLLSNPATIGVLVALLLPAVQAAREAARRNASMNNLKQLMLALLLYEDAHKAFPAHANYGADGKPLLSWRVHILPYLEQEPLYKEFHLDEPWDSEHNKKLIARMPALFVDPSSGLNPAEGKTSYLAVQGEGNFLTGTEAGRKISAISDGTSNTVALVQVSNDAAAVWTKPDDWTPDEDNPLVGTGEYHPGVFLAGFCDGHVSAISHEVDPAVWLSMLTIAGGEVLNNF